MARIQQPYKYTMNRDISWLQFNQRVLDEASTMSVPLLERVFFLSIAQSNLDEFFMIRVGSQFDIAAVKPEGIDWRSGLPIIEIIKQLYKRSQRMITEMEDVYESLVEELKDIGIVICRFSDCSKSEQKMLHEHFTKNILPVLSPQVIDAHHPFPHIQNDRKHLGLLLKRKSRQQFGIIPVPEFLPDTVVISQQPYKVISMEELIYMFSDDVFHMYEIKEKTMFHLYRNADINLFEEEVYDDSVNLKLKMKQLLKQRNLLFPVRVDISTPVSKKFIDFLSDKLGANPYQFLKRTLPLSMDVLRHSVSKEFKALHPEHRFPVISPATPDYYHDQLSMIAHLSKQDMLLHFPYQ
jgi:polyphosphate kinase